MSTFLGHIEEIPGISVDRFDRDNLKSSAFFLSHCHTDHMEGLNYTFFKHLVTSDKYLYCSPISKAFLEGIHPGLPCDRVKTIQPCETQSIPYTRYENDNQGEATSGCSYVDVTTVPAGHCPGSVMFIFGISERTILYTGDFRIHPEDLPKLKPLHFTNGSQMYPRKFDKIYLDTTFLDPEFPYLPSRKDSCQEICEAVEKWLNEDPNNVVVLECSALYGSEYLFMELAKSLRTRIHVKDKVYQNHVRIKELATHVTKDSWSTKIHACVSKMSGNRETLMCRMAKNSPIGKENILTIVPSVQRWRGRQLDESRIIEWEKDARTGRTSRLYVCYSTHPSFGELKAFIEYFRPKEIYPSVCPPETANQIRILLQHIMKKLHAPVETEKQTIVPFRLKRPAQKTTDKIPFKSKYLGDDDEFD